jgi:hypothetical protein
VELAARDQRDEGDVVHRSVVTADEQPVFAAEGLAPELALGAVVVYRLAVHRPDVTP